MRNSKEQPGENLLLPVSSHSLLYRILTERKTLTITQINENAVPDPEELRALQERDVSALYIVPMIHRGTVWGLMCIKNPSEHIGNTTLLKQISSCLAHVLVHCK
jgi:GAF domain-containing protein